MTAPRQVLPGTTYLITRRCAQRSFFLKPDRITNDVFLYVLAHAARRHGVKVHAFCVLSNHYHLVVTDPKARLPAFQQLLNALVARAVNASLGRCESFWAPGAFSAVTLVGPQDMVDKAAYTLANPVAGGLVRLARQWPGLWSGPDRIGAGLLKVNRPDHFFDANGLPETLDLELTAPPAFPNAQAFAEQVSAALAERETAASGGASGFVGVARVLSQRPEARPKTGEARGRINPRVASKDKWKRMEALGRLLDFLVSYRTALAAWREGAQDVCFPAGTYLMRVAHGVACAGAG